MITNINEFKKSKGYKNRIVEEFGPEGFDQPDFVPAPVEDEMLDTVEGEEEGVTFDQFKEAVVAKHEEMSSEDEECCELPSDEQLQLAFDVYTSLCSATPEEVIEDETEFTTDETEEVVEEGLKDFFKGGSPEEIEAKKKSLTERIEKLTSDAKEKGYTVYYKNESTDDKPVEFNKEAVLKDMEKNNFLGTILKPVIKGDKLYVIYKPGKKGLAKLAGGASKQTMF